MAQQFKPIAALAGKAVPESLQPPKPEKTPPPKRWCFSFKHWRQRDYFGLDKTDARWLTSLLGKFQVLSEEEIEVFWRTPEKRDAWRYHAINWNQPKIPVKLSDLDWIPQTYRDNPEEYPLVQFQISKTLGRVIGFWDERLVFNVVFLDPLHNMQPTKGYDYRLDDCGPLRCDYTQLLHKIERFVADHCKANGCACAEELARIETRQDLLQALNVVVLKVTDEDMAYLQELTAIGGKVTLYDLFQCGLFVTLNERLESQTS